MKNRPRSSPIWLAAAASLALHLGVGYYAWTVRTQLATANALAARATAHAKRLRSELAEIRTEAAMGSRIAGVLSAADVTRIELRAANHGFPGQALAYWSRARPE